MLSTFKGRIHAAPLFPGSVYHASGRFFGTYVNKEEEVSFAMALGQHTLNQIHALNITTGRFSGLGLSRVPTEPGTLQILVGLGGSGCDMLREAKGLINRICKDDIDKRENAKRVIYLGIDTDGSDSGPLKSEWECIDGNRVSLNSAAPDEEYFVLNNASIATMMDPSNFQTNSNSYPHVMQWLDLDAKNNLQAGQTGACGVRQAGRLCLFMSVRDLLNKLSSAINTAKLGQTITKANVFLLSGTSGGTGSGTFLDMAYILREKVRDYIGCNADSVRLFGYLLMPDVVVQNLTDPDKQSYNMRNGYAALQELEYLMNLPQVGGKFTQTYLPGEFVVDTEKAPFNHVHLLSHKDANGNVASNYYKRTMAAAAQSILSFVASETHDGGTTQHSMEAHYSNVSTITNGAHKDYPERSHEYKALGTCEYALPMDDIYKYVTTLLFENMNNLFKNEPSEDDMFTVLDAMSLSDDIWISKAIEGIMDPFNATSNSKAVFSADSQAQYSRVYEDNITAASNSINNRVQTVLENLTEIVEGQMERYFKDRNRGPIWVNHLIIHKIVPHLQDQRNLLDSKLADINAEIEVKKKERDRLSQAFFKTNADADTFMQLWNDQFRLELKKIALLYLYEDLENEPSVSTEASIRLLNMNSKLYEVVTTVLREVQKVTNANTDAKVRTEQTTPHHFTWSVIELPQITETVRQMFNGMNLDGLVVSFLSDLLSAAKDWMASGIDVTKFLEDYLDNHLQSITNTGLDHYLSALYVQSGNFPDLNTALAGPNGLFTWMMGQAKHLFLSNNVYSCSYLLSVPDTCPQIVDAAKAFCTANGITLQRSSVHSRICMQSVACAIPLYHYTEVSNYERAYHQANQAAQAGMHLRAYWTQNGQRLPGPGVENWFRLPSLIPARSRGTAAGACPEAVSSIEAYRRKLFRALAKHHAVVLEPNPNHQNETDCRMKVSEPWARCGVAEIIGTEDANLMDRGTYDRFRVDEALKLLEGKSDGKLPVARGAQLGVNNYMLDIRNVLVQCLRQISDDDSRNIEQAKLLGQTAEVTKLQNEACLRAAEEFFIASMPLCMLGEIELDKYDRLTKEIERVRKIKAELGDFTTDCEDLLKLFITNTIKQDTNRNNKSCYAYRDDSDNWDKESAGLIYDQAVIREYQLFNRLAEMRANANVHVVNTHKKIIGLAQARYDRIISKQLSAEEAKKVVETIDGFIKGTLLKRIDTYTQNLMRAQNGVYGVYTERGLEFYQQLKLAADTMKDNVVEIYDLYSAPAPVSSTPAATTSVSKSTWTCPDCGQELTGKFCPECGTRKPEPKTTWTCPNGHGEQTGKFCPECGARKPEGGTTPAPVKKWFCPECGTQNTGAFCLNCGTRK